MSVMEFSHAEHSALFRQNIRNFRYLSSLVGAGNHCEGSVVICMIVLKPQCPLIPETRVFELLEKILEKQRAHDDLLHQIAERQLLTNVEAPDHEDVELPKLPCLSLQDIRNLEELLIRSESARKKLVSICKSLYMYS
jgi:hypothetical protein